MRLSNKTRRRLRLIVSYYRGRWWCLNFHAPVIRGLGGIGGRDHWGKRRRAYHSMWCVTCDTHWDQIDRGEKALASHMWHTKGSERRATKKQESEGRDDRQG